MRDRGGRRHADNVQLVVEGSRDIERLVIRVTELEPKLLARPDHRTPIQLEVAGGIGLGVLSPAAGFRCDLHVRDRQLLSGIRIGDENRAGKHSVPPEQVRLYQGYGDHNSEAGRRYDSNCRPATSGNFVLHVPSLR